MHVHTHGASHQGGAQKNHTYTRATRMPNTHTYTLIIPWEVRMCKPTHTFEMDTHTPSSQSNRFKLEIFVESASIPPFNSEALMYEK